MTRRVNFDCISFVVRALIMAALLQCLAATAQAQAISGVVKDSSGAVLPGVTVEAASPVLIEKARSQLPILQASTSWWACAPALTA